MLKQLLIFSLFIAFFSLFPPLASAQTQDWQTLDSNCVYQGDVATIQGIECVVSNLLNVAITLIGFAVFAMLVLGSFKFLTSGGDPKAVAAARATITYAIFGLILAISAWFILNLVATLTSTNIGPFNILNFSTQISNTPNTPTIPNTNVTDDRTGY